MQNTTALWYGYHRAVVTHQGTRFFDGIRLFSVHRRIPADDPLWLSAPSLPPQGPIAGVLVLTTVAIDLPPVYPDF